MSNEKKNEVTEEDKKTRQLSEEELEQVTGGITINVGVQFASVAEGKPGDDADFQRVR